MATASAFAFTAAAPAQARRQHRTWIARLSPMALAGALMTSLAVGAAIFAPAIAHVAFDDQELARALLPPVWLPGGNPLFPLGTDFLGRDLLSRLVFGARTS